MTETTIQSDADRRANLSADRLAALLSDQRRAWERLGALAERQHALIDAGDGDGLAALMNDRQQAVDRLQVLEHQVAPFKQHWGRFVAELGHEDRVALARESALVAGLRERVLEHDRRASGAIERMRREAGEAIGRAGRASRAVNAYRPAPPEQNRFTDRRG